MPPQNWDPLTKPATPTATPTGERGQGSRSSAELLNVHQVVAVLRELLPKIDGLDLPAVLAATAMVESAGNPSAVGDTTLPGGPSFGLFQVYEGAHPELASAVRVILAQGLPPIESARRQAVALMPLFKETASGAIEAVNILASRGITITPELAAGLIDAAWNRGPGAVVAWARRTASGELRELHRRMDAFLRYYKSVAEGVAFAAGFGMVFGLAALGFLGWLVVRGSR